MFDTFTEVDCGQLFVTPDSAGGLAVSFTDTVYGSMAVYSCTQEGYNLVGSAQRVCGATSTWSGLEPFCLSELKDAYIGRITAITNQPSTTYIILPISVVDCGVPDISSAGDIPSMLSYSNTVFNSTAFYSCETGYNLVGWSTRGCLSSGQWSGAAPLCESKLYST